MTVRTCPECGHENPPDRRFCERCQEYLRWERTGSLPAVEATPEPEAPPEKPVPAEPSGRAPPSSPQEPPPRGPKDTLIAPAPALAHAQVLVAVRLPGSDRASTEPLTLHVPAGEEVEIVALVRNQDTVVRHYRLELLGLPADWWTIGTDDGLVELLPSASGSSYEREVPLRLRPPRSPEAEAREWHLRVVASPVSQAGPRAPTGERSASAGLTLHVAPFEDVTLAVAPQRASGRRSGRFKVTVANRGNRASRVELEGEDQDDALRYAFAQPGIDLQRGDEWQGRLSVRPPRQIWIGRSVAWPFAVAAVRADGNRAAATATLRQKPWLPYWLLALLPLLIAAAVAVVLLFFDRVEVPQLRGQPNQFRAAQLLEQRGLKLGAVTERVNLKAKPGTVIDQLVDAGSKVSKGREIGIAVAVGDARRRVPDVRRRGLVQAEKRLAKAGLALGTVRPEPSDPRRARVVQQVPAPGERLLEGKSVNVIVRVPGEDGDGRGGAKATAVAGMAAAAAVAALEKQGLVPVEVQEFSAEVPRGEVIRQSPEASAELATGSTVRIFVSAGYPRIAYDDGRTVVVADGASPDQATRLPVSKGRTNTEPAWSPDRRWLAYRRGGDSGSQIMRVDVDRPASSRPLTRSGHDDRRPQVSPDGDVVAFIRQEDGTSRLCFVRVAAAPADGACVDHDGPVARAAWSRDGRSIFVVTVDEDPNQTEVLRFEARRAGSARPGDWTAADLVTDGLHGSRDGDQVATVAPSPAGAPRLALAANWQMPQESQFRVLVGRFPGGVLAKPAPVGDMLGCSAAWRSDGRELAVATLVDCPGSRESAGQIFVVDPNKPVEPRLITGAGAHPAWEPVQLERSGALP